MDLDFKIQDVILPHVSTPIDATFSNKSTVQIVGSSQNSINLLQILCGQKPPISGKIIHSGLDIYEHQKSYLARGVVGVLDYDLYMPKNISVKNCLKLWINLYSNAYNKPDIQIIASCAKLTNLYNLKCSQLSESDKFLMHIARCLISSAMIWGIYVSDYVNSRDIEVATNLIHVKNANNAGMVFYASHNNNSLDISNQISLPIFY